MGRFETPMDKAFVAMGIITWITGGVMFSVGLILALDQDTFDQAKLMDNAIVWEATVWLTFVIGCFTFLIGFIGWIGHLFSNDKTLLAYIVLGSIAGTGLLCSGFFAMVYKLDVAGSETAIRLNQTLLDNNTIWHDYQKQFQCCGVNEPEDWPNIGPLPASCCPDNGTDSSTCYVEDAYRSGCYETMKSAIDTDTAIIMGLSFGTFGMQLSSIAMGGVLLNGPTKVSPSV